MSKAIPFTELVLRLTAEYRGDLASITGSRSDRELGELLDALVARELGAAVRGALFVTKSVGAVFGLELVSGERVVLKLFHPMQSLPELEAAHRCLDIVVARGFPAPLPLSPLFRTDDGIAGVFYAYAEGESCDAHAPAARRELARLLAQLDALLEDVDPRGLPPAPTRAAGLWPASHRSFLELDDDPAARWIDEIGRNAREIVRATPLPLRPAHLDWGVKNALFRGGRICAVFDWDSVFAASEAELVGRASAQFTAQWQFSARLTPTPDESRAFVSEYEAARGRAFSREEQQVVVASARYLVAQVARQEHAARAPERDDGFLALLRAGTDAGR